MIARPRHSFTLKRVASTLAAGAWLGGTLWAAAVCFLISALDTATFFGEPPTDEMWREGVIFSFVGALIAGAGPAGVWLVHRHPAWLYLAVALTSAGIGYGICVFFSSSLQ